MKKVLFFILAVTLCVAISSCRDDNFDWDKAHSVGKEVERAYEEHFKEIFGEVSPTQSWDFTQQDAATRAGSLAAPSRFGGYNTSGWYKGTRKKDSEWFDVPEDVTTWLDKNLHEQVNNSSKGYPLAFSVPSNGEFDLIPVYQGMAYSYWHMNMGIQAKDGTSSKVKFWEKNQDIEIKDNVITWDRWGGVYHLKNRKNGQYLYWPNARYIEVHSSAKGASSNNYEDQLVLKLNKSLSWSQQITVSFEAKCSQANTEIELVAQKDNGNAGWWATNHPLSIGTEWTQCKYEAWVNNSGALDGIAANGANRIVLYLNKEKAERTYQIRNINVEINHAVAKDEQLINNGNLEGDDVSSFELYENNQNKSVILQGGIQLMQNSVNSSWNRPKYPNDQGNEVYSYSNDGCYRFAVVSVKTNSVEKKCLVAFRESPEDAVFVGVNDSGKLVAVPINQVASAPDVKTYSNDYYDRYLMIGDWLVYCDNSGQLATRKVTKKSGSSSSLVYPWDVEDLATINGDNNGYKWEFEVTGGYAYEQFMVTGEGAPSGFNKGVWYNYAKSDKTKQDWQSVRINLGEKTIEKTTRSKGYHFSGLTHGDMVYFEWEVMAPYYRRQSNPILSSLSDQMRIIKYDGPTLTGIPSGKIVSIVGCEAGVLDQLKNDDPSKEPDYNDMVFLLITDEEPEIIDLENSEEVVEKRYMVEDLGASDDIDFNDMVVDLRQVKTYKVTRNLKDNTTNKELLSTKQEVILRAMGGTLDFDFKIGDKVIFTKSKLSGINYKTMYKTGMNGGKSTLLNDYDCELYRATLDGNPWEPSTNNVSFTVYKEGTSTANNDVEIDNNGSYNITFPNIGDAAPRIIAFPVTKLWRDERHECCNDWLYDREPALWEMPENAPDANKNTHTQSFSKWIKEGSNRSDYLKWVEDKFSANVKNSMETWLNKKNVVVEQ